MISSVQQLPTLTFEGGETDPAEMSRAEELVREVERFMFAHE